jgi:agmatinase
VAVGDGRGYSPPTSHPSAPTHLKVASRPASAGTSRLQTVSKKWGVQFFSAENVFDNGVQHILDCIPEGANVHVNLDLDGLDPSIMPAVFVPAPGGLSYWNVVKLIRGVAAKANLVGFAMVEFAPARDLDSNAALLAGRILTSAISAALEGQRT